MLQETLTHFKDLIYKFTPSRQVKTISSHTRAQEVLAEIIEQQNLSQTQSQFNPENQRLSCLFEPDYKCGADVEYYLKGEKLSCKPSETLQSWLVQMDVQDPMLHRVLEVIQVLETGRGSVRGTIKSIVKKFAELGFVDEIKSRGLMQMRSNFVIAKMLKELVLKCPNELTAPEIELVNELRQYESLTQYACMSAEDEIELENLIDQINLIEDEYQPMFADALLFDLKQSIKFEYTKQLKRNRSEWSMAEVIDSLTNQTRFSDRIVAFKAHGLLQKPEIDRLRTSKERLCKFLATLVNMQERHMDESEIQEYIDLKIRVLDLIKPRDLAVDEIKKILDNQHGVSVWVACELMAQNLKTLNGLARANGEYFDVDNNWIAMRMYLNSYNRGVSKITFSIMQNWVYHFSKLVLDPEENHLFLHQRDIDSSFKTSKRREELLKKLEYTFLTLCLELADKDSRMQEFGLVDFVHASRLMLSSNTRAMFIQNPVVQKLKEIYFEETGTRMSVIFSEEQMQNYYFSYGAKILRCPEDMKVLQN